MAKAVLPKTDITKASELTPYCGYSPEEEKRMEKILARYPMLIPPYYFSLIDFDDPNDPIRKMSIPSIEETDMSGSFDTSGEADNTVIPGMQHKYRQTVMILSTNKCAMYCRHCFRKRLVGLSSDEIANHLDAMVEYIKEHEEITNILISGGDSFLNSNATIKTYLEKFSQIEHLDFIRFGTRTPVVLPSRISEDEELLDILEQYNKKKRIYIVTQFNHPRELTPEAWKAVEALDKRGILMRNQSVLMKGINTDPAVLAELLKKLTVWGVAPYYIFQCRPVTGVHGQFQIPLEDGVAIVDQARLSQNGFGKNVRFAMSHESGKIEIIGKGEDGKMLFKYHQAKKLEDQNRIFTLQLEKGQCWLPSKVVDATFNTL